MQKTIRMKWCLEKDWLAWIAGIREGALSKPVGALKIAFVKPTPNTWQVPALYRLTTDVYYRGKRDGETVQFYSTPQHSRDSLLTTTEQQRRAA